MRRSGLFRHVTEIAVHSQEHGDTGRLIGVALSQGWADALLERGATEAELGLTPLREAAARHMPGPVPWWWTHRVRSRCAELSPARGTRPRNPPRW